MANVMRKVTSQTTWFAAATVPWLVREAFFKKQPGLLQPQFRGWFEELFLMANAETKKSLVQNFGPTIQAREDKVVHEPSDEQYDYHIDAFQPVVKMWLYPHGMPMRASDGPLQFLQGSHNHENFEKLRWLYLISTDDQLPQSSVSGSFRVHERHLAHSPELRSKFVLGHEAMRNLTGEGVLIIAQTSGIHRRSPAPAGTVRRCYRPMGGQLFRHNPFEALLDNTGTIDINGFDHSTE